MNVGFRFLDGTRDWGWVCKRNPVLRVEDTNGLVAVNSDTGETLGVVVMDNWSEKAVHCHIIIDNVACIRHGFMQFVGQYVFGDMGRRFIIGQVSSANIKSLRICNHLGFKEKARFEGMCNDGSDYILLQLDGNDTPDLRSGKNRNRGIK